MKIYFDDALFKRALNMIKDGYDCKDIYKDLERIEQAKANVYSYSGVSLACQLDQELRRKYDNIDVMLKIANSMQSNSFLQPLPQDGQTHSAEEVAISNLEQDRCGILCDTIVKKGLAQSIKHCIKDIKRGE